MLHTPSDFRSLGQWYADFAQTTDDEVVDLLARAAAQGRPQPLPDDARFRSPRP